MVLDMLFQKLWPRPMLGLPCGIIREFVHLVAADESQERANTVLLTGRNDIAVTKAESLAQTHGIKAVAYKVDSALSLISLLGLSFELTGPTVSDSEQVKETIAAVVRDFGRINVFVANAGESMSSNRMVHGWS